MVSVCTRDSVALRMFAPDFNADMKAVCEEYTMSVEQSVTFLNDGTAVSLDQWSTPSILPMSLDCHCRSSLQKYPVLLAIDIII